MVLLSLTVFGQLANNYVYETEFIAQNKFTLLGTSIDDYNEGKFHIDDGFQSVFAVSVDVPQTIIFDSGIMDDEGNAYECNPGQPPNPVSSANGTVYGFCEVYPFQLNHTGHYYVYVNTTGWDEDFYMLQKIEIIDADWSGLMWVFGSLFIIGLIAAYLLKEGYVTVISLFFLLGFVAEATLNVYDYIFKFWGGIITGIIVFIIVLIITFTMNEWNKK